MAAISIATGVSATGPTTAATVAEANSYTVQAFASVDGSVTAVVQVSVDGTNFFEIGNPALAQISNSGGVLAWRITNTPVLAIRLYVQSISGGATLDASVAVK